MTQPNQSELDELYERIEKLFDLRISSSGADIGIGFKTSRERSGSDRTWVDYEEWLELRQSIESFIRTEKLKLLAEVMERVVGEDEDRNHRYNENWKVEVDAQNYLRKEQRTALTKLEAEL